jgi:hypothetical protein
MPRKTLAAVLIATAALSAAPAPAMAQAPQIVPPAVATGLPIALWAITGGVLGAVAWPIMTTGIAAPIASVGALMNPGAAVGTVVGGVGYYWMVNR